LEQLRFELALFAVIELTPTGQLLPVFVARSTSRHRTNRQINKPTIKALEADQVQLHWAARVVTRCPFFPVDCMSQSNTESLGILYAICIICVKLRLQIAHLNPPIAIGQKMDIAAPTPTCGWRFAGFMIGGAKRHTSAVIKVLYYSHYQLPLVTNT